ncbi:Sorting nexin mvp1 [Cryptotrichosporon argae]
MFNTPRRSQFTSAALSSPTFDPLAAPSPSGFTDVDPWSGTQSPARSATPRSERTIAPPLVPLAFDNPAEEADEAEHPRGLPPHLADGDDQYLALFRGLQPTAEDAVSTASVQRLLTTSDIVASTLEKIVHLTCRDAHLARPNFYNALALVALAQSSAAYEPTLESLATLTYLPAPTLRPTESALHGNGNGYAVPASAPSAFSASPWDTAPTPLLTGPSTFTESSTFHANGSGSAEGAGTGTHIDPADGARGYYKRLENVDVTLVPEKEGWFLQKYRVESDKRADAVFRRYSDFAWLADTLTRRYPFRLLPALPPKRLNPDSAFLEQRRKALRRFVNAAVNHPVLQGDGALNVFMTEPNFEAWRKRVKVSTDEESASKKLSPAEELGIPADLEAKLDALRTRLPDLIASYQKMVVLAERSLARLQQSSADAARLALSLAAVAEEMPAACHRCAGERAGLCALCGGVGGGLKSFADTWERIGEERERKALTVTAAAVEALKTQRDLYTSFRDLFVRHERLSEDNVDALRKKVEGRTKKVEALKTSQKPGWEVEVDKLVSATDQDNSAILGLLARRVFIRACLWHELAVVLHSRAAAQATLAVRAWVAGETAATHGEAAVWGKLAERVEDMPID